MKKEHTDPVFILDRSGSMCGLEDDTIGGFNAMLKEQQKQKGNTAVTTVLFDDKYELLHDQIDSHDMPHMTHDDGFVRGGTALLDAIGKTTLGIPRKLRPSTAPAKSLFVSTLTDKRMPAGSIPSPRSSC